MAEMARALRSLSNLSTAIMRFPSGKYGFVGRIPAELTRPQTHGTPQIPPARDTQVYATEQDAIDALLGLGITHFQQADCTWYDA